jgi:hypothetical protein
MLQKALFFGHLEDDESVTLIAHKHWIFGCKNLFLPILSLLLSLSVLSAAKVTTIFYVAALWGIASVIWSVRNFLDYYLDAWIITNHGVIDLEWHGWFHRESARILYSDVQGVSYEIKGIIGTVLRYGNVSIEKISTGASVSLPHVPNPRKVEAIILKNMEAYLHSKNMKDAKHVQELLASMVADHMQMENFASKGKAQNQQDVPNQKQDMTPVTPTKKNRSFQSSKVGSKKI